MYVSVQAHQKVHRWVYGEVGVETTRRIHHVKGLGWEGEKKNV